MSSLVLKMIALITMIIDHYGAIFHDNIILYRIIGRIAFPIYCFLLIEGYFHTSDVKRYAKRLLIFALISEIPFDFAFWGDIYWGHQNIFFTLFIGLVAVHMINHDETSKFKNILIFLAAGILAEWLHTDYGLIGILYIIGFYFTRKSNSKFGLLLVALIIFASSMGSIQQYALIALPIIYFYNGKSGLKNKFLQIGFYAAYPLHLLIFYLMNKF